MLPMMYMSIVDDEDIPAFERIYEECKDIAYMTAFDILADSMLVEDCVADVFMSIARNFQKVNKLKPYEIVRYIVISSKNRAYDIVRKESKKKEHESLAKNIYPDNTPLVPTKAARKDRMFLHLLIINFYATM